MAKHEREEAGIVAKGAGTINRSPEEIYAYWRQLENLAHFMNHLRSVTQTDATHSHWVVDAPAGVEIEWDAAITQDTPGKVIAWQSLPDSDVYNEGEVRFMAQPDKRGTIVRVSMTYRPPAGALGKAVAKLFGEEPEQQIHEAMLKLRQLLEVGYITTTHGQPTGKRHPHSKDEAKEEASA
jgi:uncharacterized membrane protein